MTQSACCRRSCRPVAKWISSVAVPQALVIENSHLGCLHKLVILLNLALVATYASQAEIWNAKVAAKLFGIIVWPDAASDPVRADDTTVKHCADPGSYTNPYDSAGSLWTYSPTECRALEQLDNYAKRGNELVVLTHVVDTHAIERPLANCTSQFESDCRAAGSTFASNHGGCRCSRKEDFFTRNPEERRLHFFHGFKVKLPTGGESSFSQYSQVLTPEHKVTTAFLKTDGSPCTVGGVSEVSASELTSDGLHGSIREWMACAGRDLDTAPHGEYSSTVARTMGARIVFKLHYRNGRAAQTQSSNIVCFVTPEVQATWTAVYDTATLHLGADPGAGRSSRTREAYGISVDFQVVSDLRFFSLVNLINGIVNMVFLLTIPTLVMEFIISNFLGALSRIYNGARFTHFNISKQVQIAVAKSLLPLMAFRGLVGGEYNRPAHALPTLSKQVMKEHLQDVFVREYDSGRLEEKHFKSLVNLLYGFMDSDSQDFTYKEFQGLCMSNDTLDSQALVSLFDSHKQKLLEKMMDDRLATEESDTEDPEQAEADHHLKVLTAPNKPLKRGKSKVTEAESGEASGGKDGRRAEGSQDTAAKVLPGHEGDASKVLVRRVLFTEETTQKALEVAQAAVARAKSAEARAAVAEKQSRSPEDLPFIRQTASSLDRLSNTVQELHDQLYVVSRSTDSLQDSLNQKALTQDSTQNAIQDAIQDLIARVVELEKRPIPEDFDMRLMRVEAEEAEARAAAERERERLRAEKQARLAAEVAEKKKAEEEALAKVEAEKERVRLADENAKPRRMR